VPATDPRSGLPAARCHDVPVVIVDGRLERAWRRRTTAAAGAGLAVVACGAAGWLLGWSAGADLPSAGGVAFASTAIHLVVQALLRRRRRRGDLRRRDAVPSPAGPRPGLVVPWSPTALAAEALFVVGILGSGAALAASKLAGGENWYGGIGTAIVGLGVAATARATFTRVRGAGCATVTSTGVTADGLAATWPEIVSADAGDNHVVLHLLDGRTLEAGGPDGTVADERLAEVIRYYVDNPARRHCLDTADAAP
jgi:hypothetical protein